MNATVVHSAGHRVYAAAAARAFDEYLSIKNAPSCTEGEQSKAFAEYEARIAHLREINHI